MIFITCEGERLVVFYKIKFQCEKDIKQKNSE